MVEDTGSPTDGVSYHSLKSTPMEAIQRRAARFIMGDDGLTSSVSSMLENLQRESLQAWKAQAMTIMMYRIISDLIAMPSNPLKSTGTRTRWHTAWYIQPFFRIWSYMTLSSQLVFRCRTNCHSISWMLYPASTHGRGQFQYGRR